MFRLSWCVFTIALLLYKLFVTDSTRQEGRQEMNLITTTIDLPVPCSMIGPPLVLGQVPPLRKLSLSLLRFFLLFPKEKQEILGWIL